MWQDRVPLMGRARPSAGSATDQPALVAAAQGGDEEAFRDLYRAVQPGLLRYLGALVGDDAEDVASETWLQVARDLGTFRGREGFRAWVVMIGRNRAMDHLRRLRRRPAVVVPIDDLAELPDHTDAADTAASAVESMSTDTALALIRSLPRDQAEAVLLRVVVGLDAPAAGKVLGKRPGAVRTACYRGLRRLAEYLDQHTDPDSGRYSDRHLERRPVAGLRQPALDGVTHPMASTPTGTPTGTT
jgi:RNA polymerase sigma-70 factor, ECF subfamily